MKNAGLLAGVSTFRANALSTTPPPASGATIEFTCPRCGAAQRLAAATAGTRQTCSACQQTYKVPAAASSAGSTGLMKPSGSGASSSAPPPPLSPSPPPPGRSASSTANAPSAANSPPVANASAASSPTSRPSVPSPTIPPLPGAPTASAAAPFTASVVELTPDDEAPIPFDNDDETPSATPPASTPSIAKETQKPAYFTPPSRPVANAAPVGPAAPPESTVDKDSFYDEPGVGANRPVVKAPSNAPVFIDNKHRVFNDEGLILVVCGICGTRAHFAANKEGTTQQCPDCFTKFLLPKLPPGPVKKAAVEAPPDEFGEFKLEETFERQGYQPLHRDSVSADLVKGAPPSPLTGPAGTNSAGASSSNSLPVGAANYGNIVAPPLPPPIGGAAPVATIPEPIPPEARAALTADGGASMIDPENRLPRPPNWVVLVDVFNFAFRPLHLLALISFTAMAMIPVAAAVFAIARFPGLLTNVLTIGVIPPLELVPFVFIASYFVHVVHDSSYGEKNIQNWNAVNLVDNAIMAIYVFCAIFFAGLPGFLISLPFTASEGNMQVILIVISTVLLFPFCLLSLLEEESYWQTYNHEVALSFRRSKDQVFLFVCGLFIFTLATAGLMFAIGSIFASDSSVTSTIIGLGLMVLVGNYWVMTYGRMVGHLAWVMNYEAQHGVLEDD